jgi:uncharacterized protein
MPGQRRAPAEAVTPFDRDADLEPKATDDKATCLILSEEECVMLLSEAFFKTFTKRDACDTTKHTAALLAISCASREEVDAMVKAAVAPGGSHAIAPDHGFMYGWSFYDLDGHHRQVFWMNLKAAGSRSR